MSGEKTEQPTEQKLRKAREEGNVAKSKDFTETVLMGGLIAYALTAIGTIFATLSEMMLMPGQLHGMAFREALALLVPAVLHKAVEILLPFIGLVLLLGIGAEAIQTGMNVSFKAMVPKGDKLDPVKNLQQMFSMKNLMEFVKSVFKLTVLSVLVCLIVRDAIDPLSKIPLAGLGAAGSALGEMMFVLTVYTFIAFGVIALLDLARQRYQYTKGLMMSMDEVKQEYKQMEGDPLVVVTNPTHLAVALYYVEGETPLPMVLGKGEGATAEAMKRIAEEEGIPVLRDVPLARALMSQAQVNQYIPSELIEPVAHLLVTLRRMAEAQDEGQEGFDDT